jgi:hypothetical protein
MAKKKSANGGSKSSQVLSYAAEHPDEKPQAISEAMAKKGVDVTPGHVSNILSQARAKAGKNGKGKRGKRGRVKQEANVGVEQLKAAASLIKECGGTQAAIQALKAADEIGQQLK